MNISDLFAALWAHQAALKLKQGELIVESDAIPISDHHYGPPHTPPPEKSLACVQYSIPTRSVRAGKSQEIM